MYYIFYQLKLWFNLQFNFIYLTEKVCSIYVNCWGDRRVRQQSSKCQLHQNKKTQYKFANNTEFNLQQPRRLNIFSTFPYV